MVKLLYFASRVDHVGRVTEALDRLAEIAALLAILCRRGGNGKRLTDDAVRRTVDRRFVVPETPVDRAREIAPMSVRRL